MGVWTDPTVASAEPLTVERIQAAMDEVAARGAIAHGSERDPHMMNTRTGRCHCGYFVPDLVAR
jgi:hypothetical protein